MIEQCDMCRKEITSIYVIDNDMLLCPKCFLTLYAKRIEECIGVVVEGVKDGNYNEIEVLEL